MPSSKTRLLFRKLSKQSRILLNSVMISKKQFFLSLIFLVTVSQVSSRLRISLFKDSDLSTSTSSLMLHIFAYRTCKRYWKIFDINLTHLKKSEKVFGSFWSEAPWKKEKSKKLKSLRSIGLVVKALNSQSRDPVFKTTAWLQDRFSLSFFQDQSNEYQEFPRT